MLNPVAAIVIQTRVRHWRLAAKSHVTHSAPSRPVISRMEGRVMSASQKPGQLGRGCGVSTKICAAGTNRREAFHFMNHPCKRRNALGITTSQGTRGRRRRNASPTTNSAVMASSSQRITSIVQALVPPKSQAERTIETSSSQRAKVRGTSKEAGISWQATGGQSFSSGSRRPVVPSSRGHPSFFPPRSALPCSCPAAQRLWRRH